MTCFALSVGQGISQVPLYKQTDIPIEERIDDLLQRMTLEEKVGQLMCPMGWEMYDKTGGITQPSSVFRQKMDGKMPIGAFWAVLRADPWTKKTLKNGLNPRLAAETLNKLQKYAVENTRLGIPILFAEECPHGHMAIGTTVFPTGLSLASSWNEELLYQIGEAVALEARLQGANIGYGPVLDLARDPRWSRMEETYGEDPVLTGKLGVAYMTGMQGSSQSDGKHLYSTLKHFAAYGIPQGGHNGAPVNVGTRQLFTDYLYPFKEAVEAGVGTIMTSYNMIDGVPCTANKFLLTDVLRNRWNFTGFVFSDLFSIDGIASARVAKDVKDAGRLALRAGVDMDLGANAYGKNVVELVKANLLDIRFVDRAVKNVLRLKFKMGLFENPYVSPEKAESIIRCDKHKQLARQAAREGIVLLKNDGILPLDKTKLKSVAVIGPNADMMYNQLGDYTAPQDDKEIVTPLEGIQKAVGSSVKVRYVKGCAVRDVTRSDIASAVKAARESDVVILVVGGSSARDFKTEYISTGAATVSSDNGSQLLSDMDCGEGYDRCTLSLLGDQERLLQEVIKTGKPLIVVYIQGRTLDMNLASEKANALLTAWYPGEEGGDALAEIIFGDYNPSGRLPVSVPRNEGQIPVYYSNGPQRDYLEGSGNPLYSFGYGLSYTQFEYSNLRILPGNDKDIVRRISCTVTNVGQCSGSETVQLYVNDMVASVAQPPIALKAFKKVYIPEGESKEVTFDLYAENLSFYDVNLKPVVEPGDFKVMVGAASNDIRLNGMFQLDTLEAESSVKCVNIY